MGPRPPNDPEGLARICANQPELMQLAYLYLIFIFFHLARHVLSNLLTTMKSVLQSSIFPLPCFSILSQFIHEFIHELRITWLPLCVSIFPFLPFLFSSFFVDHRSLFLALPERRDLFIFGIWSTCIGIA